MADILFVLKSFLVTFILVVVMQIQVGNNTIESHLQGWIRGSVVVQSLRDIAHGAVKVISQGYQSTVSTLDTKLGRGFNREQMAGTRGFGWPKERSESYRKEETKRAEQERARQEDESAYATDTEDATL